MGSTVTTAGSVYASERGAKGAARLDLSPFVVELAEEAGGGYAWFPAGTAWFGEHAEVPEHSRVVAVWGWVKPVVTDDGGRRVFGGPRRGWENVRFGKSRPGLR